MVRQRFYLLSSPLAVRRRERWENRSEEGKRQGENKETMGDGAKR
jgi:hypothetical protein